MSSKWDSLSAPVYSLMTFMSWVVGESVEKSKEFNRVPIVPGVPVVPNVQFRFMNKIDCEAPRSASPCAFLQCDGVFAVAEENGL